MEANRLQDIFSLQNYRSSRQMRKHKNVKKLVDETKTPRGKDNKTEPDTGADSDVGQTLGMILHELLPLLLLMLERARRKQRQKNGRVWICGHRSKVDQFRYGEDEKLQQRKHVDDAIATIRDNKHKAGSKKRKRKEKAAFSNLLNRVVLVNGSHQPTYRVWYQVALNKSKRLSNVSIQIKRKPLSQTVNQRKDRQKRENSLLLTCSLQGQQPSQTCPRCPCYNVESKNENIKTPL